MPTLNTLLFLAACSFLFVPQQPRQLTKADLTLNSVRVGMTSTEVKNLPWDRDRIGVAGIRHGFGWKYDGAYVYFDSAGSVISILITHQGTMYSTKRGLRVGDVTARALELYGKPSTIEDGKYWDYLCSDDTSLGLTLTFKNRAGMKSDTLYWIQMGKISWD
jgi:hypothetical protein